MYIGITHVGGDALESVPAGDAIFTKVSLSLLISSTYLQKKKLGIFKKKLNISTVVKYDFPPFSTTNTYIVVKKKQ
jgi:hypothetical protein